MQFSPAKGLFIGAALLAALPFLPTRNAASVEAGAIAADVPVLQLDPVHSSVNFRIKHLGTSFATGRFNEIAGEFAYDPKQLDKSSLTVTIQTASVDTNSQKRDQHLRGADFFLVEQFPTLVFKSTRIKKTGDDLTVAGKVSWMGQEKDLTTTVVPVGQIDNPNFGNKRGFTTSFVLKRSDFGIKYGLEGDVLGDEVQVTLDIEAALP